MQKNIYKFLALFLALVCIFYFIKKIQNTPSDNPNDLVTKEVTHKLSLPDDFHIFYDKYHTDSLFQLERTMFPLKGLARSTDSTKVADETLWQKNEWLLHKPFDAHNDTFKRVFTNIGGIITEQISANKGLFSLEKRYAKLNGDWHLIYYQELLMHG